MARLAYLLVAVALTVAACGDSGSDETAGNGAGDDTQLAVVATEFAFTPDAYLADSGNEVTVTVTNEGSIEHNWVLLSQPIRSEDDLTPDIVLAEAGALPAAAGTVTFTAPAAGTYQVICDIAGHFAAGMEGELTVSG